MSTSISYYTENAKAYFDSTVSVDMTPLYEAFLPLVPDGGSILDAGCGSGRDALAFKSRGYSVTAFDASGPLCKLAEGHLGQEVKLLQFSEVSWEEQFDAVWACASLLHVPLDELPGVFSKLMATLKRGGVMYCSFKVGDGVVTKEERVFTNLSSQLLSDIVEQTGWKVSLTTWISGDQKGREEQWLNTLIQLKA
ncbi:class I SAM-dependent methyltransferase [Marinobacter sp.]|uniref:class I SAM-dependent methyltransferase n=1 Tax=Marinobacter sp. TaxID=50741 RepID=UPI00384A95C1